MERRAFLTGLGATTLLLDALAVSAQAQPPVRRAIHDLGEQDPTVETLRAGIRLLREARSGATWQAMALIHGNERTFNRCSHGNWYFLPWHRAYIHSLETMIRSLTQNADFAMPYWDWTANPTLPPQFVDSTFAGRPNSLFEARRYMERRSRLPAQMVGPDVIARILDETLFEIFGNSRPRQQNSVDARWAQAPGASGQLESNPHNGVHVTVGGRDGQRRGNMALPSSALDPLFWLHHCNVDRIWAVWTERGNRNPTDDLWLNMSFDNSFIRPDGRNYSMRVRDLISPAALGYGYEGQSPGRPVVAPTDRRLSSRAALIAAILGGDLSFQGQSLFSGRVSASSTGAAGLDIRFNVPAAALRPVLQFGGGTTSGSGAADTRPDLFGEQDGSERFDQLFNRGRSGDPSGSATDARPGGRVIALLSGIAPERPDASELELLVRDRPVGRVSFFGGEHAGHGGGAHGGAHGGGNPMQRSVWVDLTRDLEQLGRQAFAADGSLSLQVRTRPASGSTAGSVKLERAEIVVLS